MDIDAEDGRQAETGSLAATRLRELCIDLRLLRRLMVLAVTDQKADHSAAIVVARCIAGRLCEGRMLASEPAGETALTAALGRYFDRTGGLVDRLRTGAPIDELAMGDSPSFGGETLYDADLIRELGLQRICRLREMETLAARVSREMLYGAALLLAAAQSPRRKTEPDTPAGRRARASDEPAPRHTPAAA